MADNPFVVQGDEWSYCRKHHTRCTSAWEDGTCMRYRCNKFDEYEEETDNDDQI